MYMKLFGDIKVVTFLVFFFFSEQTTQMTEPV